MVAEAISDFESESGYGKLKIRSGQFMKIIKNRKRYLNH